jgi:pyruvate dehydrogenase E2 component (dihydrolipoamide acetyltransferase)
MIKEVIIPDIGENIEKGDVIEVLVKVGDSVELDQPLVEFETDKAVVDIPSSFKGKVVEILVNKGDTVQVGKPIIKIETDSTAFAQSEKQTAPPKPTKEPTSLPKTGSPIPEKTAKPAEKVSPVPIDIPKSSPTLPDVAIEPVLVGGSAPASPTVRRLAREVGADINKVTGTGPGGRISEDDVKAFVKKIVLQRGSEVTSVAPRAHPLPDLSKWGEIRKEKLSRVRQVISESVANSWSTVPHVTQFDKADITELEEFRKSFNKKNEKKGVKLTVTAVLMRILAQGLKEFPRFNASIDPANELLIYRDYIHIGIAVDTDRGLLVPVVRNIDKMSIVNLAKSLDDIATRARDKSIKPEEFEGGTFTISNQGGIGGVDFTPIVLWPQVAILGVSRASMQPIFTNGEFVPRLILPLSLSYDHRANDGADAARFLRWICEALEQPLILYVDK